jgi:hypothetical protein
MEVARDVIVGVGTEDDIVGHRGGAVEFQGQPAGAADLEADAYRSGFTLRGDRSGQKHSEA